MKYTKKQIEESIKYWKKVLEAMENVPVMSSIDDFLKLCKDKGIDVEKKRVAKQGKIINAEIAQQDKQIKSREGVETAHAGDLVIDDGDGTFYAVPAAKIAEYYELDKDGNSVTGEQTKWKKIGKDLEYYITPFDIDVKVEWQSEPLHATAGYSLVCNDKEGKDISPVAPEVFSNPELWKPLQESLSESYEDYAAERDHVLFTSIESFIKAATSDYDYRPGPFQQNPAVGILLDLVAQMCARSDSNEDLMVQYLDKHDFMQSKKTLFNMLNGIAKAKKLV